MQEEISFKKVCTVKGCIFCANYDKNCVSNDDDDSNFFEFINSNSPKENNDFDDLSNTCSDCNDNCHNVSTQTDSTEENNDFDENVSRFTQTETTDDNKSYQNVSTQTEKIDENIIFSYTLVYFLFFVSLVVLKKI